MGARVSATACCSNTEPVLIEQTYELDPELTEEAIKEPEKEDAEAEEKRKKEEEDERIRAEELRLAQLREEEECKRLQEEAERKAEEERLEAEAAKKRGDEEEARLHKERAEAEEQLAKEASEKSARLHQVSEWLKKHKFAGHSDKKASCCASTYPIHAAAEAGEVDIVRGLLECKADPTQKNSKGSTATQLAVLKKHADVITLLQAPVAAS